MKRKLWIPVASASLLIATLAFAGQHADGHAVSPALAPHAAPHSMAGRIIAVRRASQEITLQTADGQTHEVKVPSTAAITSHSGKPFQCGPQRAKCPSHRGERCRARAGGALAIDPVTCPIPARMDNVAEAMVEIRNKLGLHIHPSDLLAKTAVRFPVENNHRARRGHRRRAQHRRSDRAGCGHRYAAENPRARSRCRGGAGGHRKANRGQIRRGLGAHQIDVSGHFKAMSFWR